LRSWDFVVMLERIHVLIREPKRNTVPKVVQVLKQRVARRLLRKPSAQRELWERSRRRFGNDAIMTSTCIRAGKSPRSSAT
jgi:REP element-mobilizing transposase RayT